MSTGVGIWFYEIFQDGLMIALLKSYICRGSQRKIGQTLNYNVVFMVMKKKLLKWYWMTSYYFLIVIMCVLRWQTHSWRHRHEVCLYVYSKTAAPSTARLWSHWRRMCTKETVPYILVYKYVISCRIYLKLPQIISTHFYKITIGLNNS